MSGTSMDAIDTALVQIDNGSLELVEYEQFPISDAIRNPVRELSAASKQDEIDQYDRVLGELFADAVLQIINRPGLVPNDITAIGSHGQTILHLPDADPPRTLQIGDASIIANKTGIKTVADFRRKDMEAGGQGAPLAPALHASQFRSQEVNRCILNLGGIANITVLPADPNINVTGFDTGPGNGLMDDWNYLHNHTSMDEDGNWALSGTPDEALLEALLKDPYFRPSCPKSTGRDYFNLTWLNKIMGRTRKTVKAEDIQATLLQLTIFNIADAIKNHEVNIEELYLCGGGAHNPAIVSGLRMKLPGIEISTTDKLGMDPDAVEAITFAWLARQRIQGLPGNLPSVTGAKKAVLLGSIFEPAV